MQVLERKVARLQGERSDEEREALSERIKVLTEQYDTLADTKVFLEDQVRDTATFQNSFLNFNHLLNCPNPAYSATRSPLYTRARSTVPVLG